MPGEIFRWAAPLFDRSSRRWNHDDVSAITQKLETFVGPEGRLLDIGGGTGRLGGLLAVALRCDVTVLDSSSEMLRDARDLPHVTTTVGDAAHLPFEDGSFDAAILVDSLHRFARQREVLQETARVLRPGGGVLVTESDPHEKSVKATAVVERILGEPGAFLAPEDLAAMLADCGVTGSVQTQHGSSYVFVGTRS